MRGYTTDRRVGAEQQVPRIERGETESASPGPRGALCELVEQRTRSLEVGGGQPFGEPGVDLGQQTPRVPSLALPLEQSAPARGRAQLDRLCALASGDLDGLAEALVGVHRP